MIDTATTDPLEPVPYGYCHCGCGQRTKSAKYTDNRRGYIKGQPACFLPGHYARVQPKQPCQGAAKSILAKVDRTSTPDGCHEWMGYRNKGGYGRVRFNSGRRLRMATHVVLELAGFIIPLEWLVVRHLCNNPPCVRVDHLKIGTLEENNEDRDSQGRQARGERLRGRARLRGQQDAEEIRRLYAAGGILQRTLAHQFGVSQSAISAILRGETWQERAA
jgi:hypothetical protein